MTTTAADVYVTSLTVDEIFADETYQRPCDTGRARRMAQTWDRRLAGIIEVSDRGSATSPRFAVLDGQHRWAAAALLDEPPALVANVHEGLTVADEAALFDKLNRQRRQPTTWDHWRARKAAGDPDVLAIEKAVAKRGLKIDSTPKDGNVRCTSTLEKLAKIGGVSLIGETLGVVTDVWGERLDGFDAPIVHGIGLVLHYLREPLDVPRVVDALFDVMPRQLKTHALALRDMTTGAQPVLVAIAIMSLYNKKPGKKILVSNRTFGGGSRNAHSVGSVA
jgi:hypothetical protein